MRTILIITAILFRLVAVAQEPLSGDGLLTLLGQPASGPLFQQFKQQQDFITNAWNRDFSIYTGLESEVVKELELEYGKRRYGSDTARYGFYRGTLPLRLNWNMRPVDLEQLLEKPVWESEKMHIKDYLKSGWKLRIFFENDAPVSVSYQREGGTSTAIAATVLPVQPATLLPTDAHWVLQVNDARQVQADWPSLRQLIVSSGQMNKLAGKDSVDYIGQVYYSTPWKVAGFERTAIKRAKKNSQWFYEAFYTTNADSEQVRALFFALYDNLKKTIKDNTADDFILAAVAGKPISADPVNWIAQWTLYSGYKTLPAGLSDVKIALVLSGMKNAFGNNKMDYTLKLYVMKGRVEYDFWTWDAPRD